MSKNVSIVMATYNGSKFIKQQLESILVQLSVEDEIIISDNYSKDDTIEIVKSINDPRIKIFLHKQESDNSLINCYLNFENAIKKSSGAYIFFSDQDDLWHIDKVKKCLNYLQSYDLVVTDCKVISENGETVLSSFFEKRKSGKGLIKNLVANSYLGCCMAINRKMVEVGLPFPLGMPAHDVLFGVIGELFYKPFFINEQLTFYREHPNNITPTTDGKTKLHFGKQLLYRFKIITCIPLLFYRKHFR